jgi:hypothetical protein
MLIYGPEMVGRSLSVPRIVHDYLKILEHCFPEIVFEIDCNIFPWPKHPSKYMDVANRFSRIYYFEPKDRSPKEFNIRIWFLYQTQAWIIRVCGELNEFGISDSPESGKKFIEECSLLPVPQKVVDGLRKDCHRNIRKFGGYCRVIDFFVRRSKGRTAKHHPTEEDMITLESDGYWAKNTF